MRRENLNKYIGDTVTITFFDGTGAFGKLCFSDEYSEENDWIKAGYYYIRVNGFKIIMVFKASDVKKLRIFLKGRRC